MTFRQKLKWALLVLGIAGIATPQSPPTAIIRGFVQTPEGQGIPDTLITFVQRSQASGPATTATDANGEFQIDAVAGEEYLLRPRKQGYIIEDRARVQADVPNQTIVVAGDESGPPLLIQMVPQAILSGRIHNQFGDPVQGMVVCVFRADREGTSIRLVRNSRVTTDDRGVYRAVGLTSGRYYVEACPVLPPWFEVTVKEALVATFYPGELRFPRAVPIDLETGAERLDIDISMSMQDVFHIKGIVLDAEGQPSPFAEVYAIPGGPDYDGTITSRWLISSVVRADADGWFDIAPLPAGTYHLRALGYEESPANPSTGTCIGCIINAGPSVEYGVETVSLGGADVVGLVLQVRAPQFILGKVLLDDASGDPVPDVSIQFQADRFTDVDLSRIFNDFETRSGPDGAFEFPNAWATQFYVSVSNLPPGTYLKSLTYGDQDLLATLLDHTGDSNQTVEVVLSPAAADLKGSVQATDASVASGAQVFAWPTTSTVADDFSGAITNRDGTFAIGNLKPDDYYVIAFQSADIQLIRDPRFRDAISGDAFRLSLGESAHIEHFNLPVVPMNRVLELVDSLE